MCDFVFWGEIGVVVVVLITHSIPPAVMKPASEKPAPPLPLLSLLDTDLTVDGLAVSSLSAVSCVLYLHIKMVCIP